LFAGVFFFEFVEGAEAFGFEAAFRERRLARAGIVQADKEDANFPFLTLETDADSHFADDINDAGFGQGGIELLDAERKFIVDANHFGTNRHSREKIYAGGKCASGEEGRKMKTTKGHESTRMKIRGGAEGELTNLLWVEKRPV
jgi:hypothetical protein